MLAQKLMAASARSAPIEYVGGYVIGFLGTTSDITITFGGNLTGGIASSASANDLVLVYFGTGSASDRNLVVAGYTEVAELFAADESSTNLVVAYKFMGGTPDTNFILTGGTLSTADGGAVAVQVWRNVNVSTPLDVTPTTNTQINTVLCNPPPITPVTSGAYIVSGGAGAHTRGVRTYGSSDLSGFITVGSGNDTYDATVGVGYKQWVSGAFDPATFTFSEADSTTFSCAAVTLALRPK
jgi:hypothetical protein